MIQFPDPAARELPPETRAEPQRVKRKHKGKKKLKQKRNHHHELQSLFQAFFAPNKLLAARSLADRLNALVAQRWPGSQVDVFGSCASGLAGPDSDVDLVAHGHGDLARGDPSAIVKVHHFLEDCELGLCEFRRVLNARVPLLKFKTHVGGFDIQVDLSLGQPVKRYNSLLLKEYADLDPRSKFLLVIVRSWAKRRGVSTVYREHTPSPYAHALLVITYLQTLGLPNLQQRRVPRIVDGIDVSFETLPGNEKDLLSGLYWRTQTGELSFFPPAYTAGLRDDYFDYFEIVEDYFAWVSSLDPIVNGLSVSAIVSPRLGTVTPKSANDSEAWRLSIEDPLDHFASARPRDLGDVLNPEGQVKLFAEVRRARKLLAQSLQAHGRVETLFDPVEILTASPLPPAPPVASSEIARAARPPVHFRRSRLFTIFARGVLRRAWPRLLAPPPILEPPAPIVDDLRTLLEARGLPPDVIAALEAEEVDSVATLALLTEDDLAGIIAPEPRRTLLDVIGVLNGETRGARPAIDPEESAARNLSPSARAWSPPAPAPPPPEKPRELDAAALAALRQLPDHTSSSTASPTSWPSSSWRSSASRPSPRSARASAGGARASAPSSSSSSSGPWPPRSRRSPSPSSSPAARATRSSASPRRSSGPRPRGRPTRTRPRGKGRRRTASSRADYYDTVSAASGSSAAGCSAARSSQLLVSSSCSRSFSSPRRRYAAL